MKAMHAITMVLLVVGGLNWLLVGLFGWDVSRWLGGMEAMLPRVIYILVGLAALVEIFMHKSTCKYCETKAVAGQPMA